jgi:hypothetical protein
MKRLTRVGCLLAIAQALECFREYARVVNVRLGPDTVIDQIAPLLKDPSFLCRCQILRESLYRMLSKVGNPSLDSLAAVLRAFGMRLAVQSMGSKRRKSRPA